MSYPRLEIEYADESTEVVQVKASDVIRFEAHFGVPYMTAWIDAQMAFERVPDIEADDLDSLTEEEQADYIKSVAMVSASIKSSHLYFLAYSAKTKGKGDPFEDWLDTIETVTYKPGPAEDDAAPLAQGGSSPTPPSSLPSLSTPDEPSSPS